MYVTFALRLYRAKPTACASFEAGNPDVVKEVNETAQIPFTRIVEALDLTP